ncbi:MAG: stalk domain-containing protein, partial [Heliobacteriaceae bacterium]|nr:stalk domain-containing protein [Heliobacteriaceae bacterium]
MRGRLRTAVMISFLVLFSATPVFAQPTLLWNGQPWFVEQELIADGGRLLIDAADLARAMGAVLTYNAPFIEFRWQDGMPVQAVQMGPDSPVALIRRAGGQATEVTLDVMPQVSRNRVLVPLRFLVEKTGGSTQWYSELETVSVHYGELSLVRLAKKEAELGRMFFDRKLYAESLGHYQEA